MVSGKPFPPAGRVFVTSSFRHFVVAGIMMKRAITLVATFGLLAVAPLLFGQVDLDQANQFQGSQGQANQSQSNLGLSNQGQAGVSQMERPSLPSGVLGPQLIVWSQQQRPRPLPPAQNYGTTPQLRSQAQTGAKSFEGTITQSGGRLVLLEASTHIAFQLQDQAGQYARKFEGRKVGLTATADSAIGVLDVTDITPTESP
jgi:hypothetical protein